MPLLTIRGNDLPGRAGIYTIRNLASGRIYVGRSRTIFQRWLLHFSALKGGRHSSKDLQEDWNRHGAECFEFQVLEYTEDLPLHEAIWIEKLRNEGCQLYNRTRNESLARILGRNVSLPPDGKEEMRYRQFYIGCKTDSTAHHEHGGNSKADITIWRGNRKGELHQHGKVEIELRPEGLKIRFYNALGELVAELLNGVMLPAGGKEEV